MIYDILPTKVYVKQAEKFDAIQKEEPIVEEIKETKKLESEDMGFSMNLSPEEQFEHIEDDISEDDLKKALEDIESLSFDEIYKAEASHKRTIKEDGGSMAIIKPEHVLAVLN